MKTIRSAVKWYGGKYYLAKYIVNTFPAHRIYLEPFGGGASVLLNKEPSEIEVYGDIDRRITRLFYILRNRGEDFVRKVNLILYSEVEFNNAMEYVKHGTDELELAICDFVLWRQSFSGLGESWSYTTKRSRGGMAGDVNAWWSAIDGLPVIINRLRRVEIVCKSAFELIPKFDNEDALIYCDPPYLSETRHKQCRQSYKFEMTTEQHVQLGDLLNSCKSKVVLSGYDSELYRKLYANWRIDKIDIANHASKNKKKNRKSECIWVNFK